MAEPVVAGASPAEPSELPAEGNAGETRKEKRKAAKKTKRKQARMEAAIREREEDESRANDPEEKLRIRVREQEEAEAAERERRVFEERERLWLEAAAVRKAEEEERRRLLEESQKECEEFGHGNVLEEDDDWEYVEEGPAEIIWQGNEIIVKKKKVRVPKKRASKQENEQEEDERPTSNPFPPQSEAFASYMHTPAISAQEVLESVSQQIPNFGTEQDKTHCPFHLKTGACRFGSRCSRVHFHPDTSCTLLMKNMYNGPGLAWEQDEGLEYTDEEVEHSYEEFYEDVHTEFLKFGELVNFKVCRNGSYHLRGNVYVHYKTLESAILGFNTMNGRYFAGRQITCEFVGVTRWKVAICGEYMKSRLKNCSRGTACNFIHCFHNPGGDYEWADWDNPPPKYWIRKMSALFGPSDEADYERQMEPENQERSSRSSRKRTPSGNRYASTRSDRNEMAKYHYGYSREDSDGNKEQCYSDSSKEHSIRNTKEKPLLDKHEHRKEKRKSSTSSYSVKHHSHGRHSNDESHKLSCHTYGVRRHSHDRYYGKGNLRESGRGSVKEHRDKYGFVDHERRKQKPRPSEDMSRRHRKKEDTLEVQPKSNKYHKEFSSPDQSGSTYYGGDQNSSHSMGKSLARKIIDAQDRYDGRYFSDNVNSDIESSAHESRLLHENCSNEEQAYDHHAHERDDNGKSWRQDGSKLRYSSDESFDGRPRYSCSQSLHAFSRHSASEEPGNSSENSGHGHSRSGKKRRHRHDKTEYEDSEESRHDRIQRTSK